MRREQKHLKQYGLPKDYFQSKRGSSTLDKLLYEGQKLPAMMGRLTPEQIMELSPFLASIKEEDLRRYCFSEFKNSILATDPYALKVFARVLFHAVGDSNAAANYEWYAERLIMKWQLQ